MEHTELVALVDGLEAAVAQAGGGELAWREVWDRIRRVGEGFRGIRFPSREEHKAQWERFRAQVDRTKELQEQWRGQAEEKAGPLLERVETLAAALAEGDGARPRWKDCWEEIRSIGDAFKATPFPRREDRSAAWKRFQEVVSLVKEAQGRERAARREMAPGSRRLAAELLALVASARPLREGESADEPVEAPDAAERDEPAAAAAGDEPGAGADDPGAGAGDAEAVAAGADPDAARAEAAAGGAGADVAIADPDAADAEEATGGAEADAAAADPDAADAEETAPAAAADEAPLPPAPPRTTSLKDCSARLREARRRFGESKDAMLPQDRRAVFEAMKSAGEALDAAWAAWKESRSGGGGAGPAAPAADGARREEWEARMRENVARLEDRLARLREVEERKERHMEELQRRQRGAGGGDFRARIETWLDEERQALASVREKMSQVQTWLAEARGRLGGEA